MAGFSAACRGVGDIPAAVAALERAYLLRVNADERAEAGIAALILADIELSELGASAVASGWLAQARRHLQLVPDHPAHARLEGMSCYISLAYDKDPEAAMESAERSLAHARRVGDTGAETLATAFLGLVEVSCGQLQKGFQRLDASSAAALAGELDPLDALDTFCILITACERVRDFDRVDQWAQRVLTMAEEVGSDAFATFARTQFANVLIWRGKWVEAEVELDRVVKDAADRPMTAAMGMVLRASLRRRQGRLDDAASELTVAEREPYRRAVRHLVLAARAGLELDRGDPQAAADLAERYLHVVSRLDRIERIDALETLVRARLQLGEIEAADAAATELDESASAIGTDGIRGAALVARALVRLAAGDDDRVRRALEEAIAVLDAAALPYETLSARLVLADVLVGLGQTAAARREADEARAAAADLGADAVVAAADTVLARLRGGRTSAEGLTSREVKVLGLMAQGRSNAEIAESLVLSVRTVERHVSNIYLKVGATGPAARTIAVAFGRRCGLIP